MKKNYGAIILLSFLIVGVGFILFFSKNNTIGVVNDNKSMVVVEDNELIIRTEDGFEYNKELSYPQFIDKIILNNYEFMQTNGDSIISISINCTEVEERGNFDTLLIYLYKDSQFINLLDGLEDRVFQSENYILTYQGNRTISISLPESKFVVTLKNTLTYEDSQLNDDNEKDLISRMEHQSSVGYPILSQGFNNIQVNEIEGNDIEGNDIEGNIKISLSKFVYGFFHSDIIGEIHYNYDYNKELKSLVLTINFEPYEDYEIINN